MLPIALASNMSTRSRISAGVLATATALATVLVVAHEGRRNVAYQDSGAHWTICDGHTRGVKPGDVASDGQCDAYRIDDLRRATVSIESCLSAQLTANQLGAFQDFEFNTGRFCGSSIMRHANSGNIKAACTAIGLYMYAAGKDCRIGHSCPGIVRRRLDEIALCWPDFSKVT